MASSGRGTNDFCLKACPDRLLAYRVDNLQIRMPSIACQARIFIGLTFQGWVSILSPLVESDRCRVALPDHLIGPTSGDRIDKCGLVTRLNWSWWQKPVVSAPVLNPDNNLM
jgi:hypothetical protein